MTRAWRAIRRDCLWQLGASLTIGLSFTSATAFTLFVMGWDAEPSIPVVLMQGSGSFAGSWLAGSAASALAAHLVAPRRAPLWLVLSAGGAFAGAALVFAVAYKATFAQWHFPFPSIGWALQTVVTMAAAVFYYAVQGSRLVLPWVAVPLVGLALAFARRSR